MIARLCRSRERGLTFLEILVVLSLMALLSLVALPFLHVKYRRYKEIELERRLESMREAIDRYHEYASLGQIEPPNLEWNMYPESLDELVEGVEVKPATDQPPVVVRFLRSIPVDPMTGEASWDCRGYEDEDDDRSSSCDDVYDVFSRSQDQAIDGTYYYEW